MLRILISSVAVALVVQGCGNTSDSTQPGVQSSWEIIEAGSGVDWQQAWADTSTDVYLVGSNGAVRRLAKSRDLRWQKGNLSFACVWGISDVDVRAAHYDEGSRTSETLKYSGFTSNSPGDWWVDYPSVGIRVRDVWSDGASVYAVGTNGARGAISFIDVASGGSWIPLYDESAPPLFGVWGRSGTDLFAVGERGAILHFSGSAWDSMESGTPSRLYSVWGTSSAVFAVGSAGTILVLVDGEWNPMASSTSADLRCVWGYSDEDVYAVGDGGTLLHYDGVRWSSVDSGTTANLRAVAGNSGLVIVAGSGTILRTMRE